jgi:hypothetical protein
MGSPIPSNDPEQLRQPFDYPNEKVVCARDGQECQPLGHLLSRFLLCPTHGEFTIAPVVMEQTTGWVIVFEDVQAKSMWEAARYIDAQGLSGRATRTG